jgi:hypothetical protein
MSASSRGRAGPGLSLGWRFPAYSGAQRTSKLIATAASLRSSSLQATRPGPMLRGGTVLLLSRPHSGGFFMAPRLSAEPGTLDRFEGDTMDRLVGGSSVVQPRLLMCVRRGCCVLACVNAALDCCRAGTAHQRLRCVHGWSPGEQQSPLESATVQVAWRRCKRAFVHLLCRFGRPNRASSLFGLPRRPCPFGRDGPHNPDAMLKHMAAARFGPDLLASLLASAEVLPCCARARRHAVSAAMLPVDAVVCQLAALLASLLASLNASECFTMFRWPRQLTLPPGCHHHSIVPPDDLTLPVFHHRVRSNQRADGGRRLT